MGKDAIRIKRQELYKRVWETPVTQLAKEYGLSDVGFAKICKKHNIPRPPRGYWARKAAGQRLKQLSLPRQSTDEIIEISPNLSNKFSSAVQSEPLLQLECEKDLPPIVVAKSLRNPHPFVSQSAEILELCKPNEVGILESMDENCLDIRVSRNSLRRALRIMDALIKGLLEREFEVFQGEDSFNVQIQSECLGFGISEELITKKIQPMDVKLDGDYQFGHNLYDSKRMPSGKLCLTILDRSYFWGENLRKNWRDTQKKQLEANLDDFVRGLIKRAARKIEYNRQQEEEERHRREIERQREEERQRLVELKLKIQQEKMRVAKLINDAENFNKSKLIRDFITVVENERANGSLVYVTDENHENWVKWAQEQADRLDPLSNNPPSILDKETDTDDEQLTENKGPYSYFEKW